ncbi:MAG TPA: malate synthase A, partial [Pseudoxanthomonas sp.]|nr:malate synthase A [Pseudoxanthomonas sp.]
IPVARAIFDERMPRANQHDVLREDAHVGRDELIAPSAGTITRAGFEGNVEVCVRYLAAWLDGNGCVPIHWLMEDAATAEISRTQLWQWLHNEGIHLADGTAINFELLDATLRSLPARLGDRAAIPGGSKIDEAIGLLDELSRSDRLAEFLTLPAYERID